MRHSLQNNLTESTQKIRNNSSKFDKMKPCKENVSRGSTVPMLLLVDVVRRRLTDELSLVDVVIDYNKSH